MEVGSKVQVTFHRLSTDHCSIDKLSDLEDSLDLLEHFVKGSGLGDTFNAIHLSVSW